MYNCCHSERQLATWLVEECIFRVLGTKSITIENVSKLSQKIDALPADLRETVIGTSLVDKSVYCCLLPLTCNASFRAWPYSVPLLY